MVRRDRKNITMSSTTTSQPRIDSYQFYLEYRYGAGRKVGFDWKLLADFLTLNLISFPRISGHKISHLLQILPALRENSDRLIWLAGDSSLDNKYW